jgi:hypothetical protein
MSLTFTELESVTNDYFIADNKKAVDIYFKTSFFVNYFMEKKKGLWKRPEGGQRWRVPLQYDEAAGGFYTRASTLSSDDREMVNAAYFLPKHVYGNASIFRTDEQENAGPYAEVELVTQKIEAAQKTCANWIAKNIYALTTDGAAEITGVRSLCFGAAATAYGGIAENDLVATDGTKPWVATNTTTTEGITLDVIRTLASSAKLYDGPKGKPDIGLTTETLFNIISGILQVQQRFTQDTDTVKAGFENLVFEGKIIAADDFATSGYLYLFNSSHVGFAIHKNGYFARTPWMELLPTGVAAKTMKIFWDGNLICSNRKAHAGHNNLS